MKKKIVCLLSTFFLLLSLLPTTAYAATTIDNVDITVMHPVHLAGPDVFLQVYGGTCQIDTNYHSDGYKNGLRWKDVSTGKTMSTADVFVGGKQYELSVCVFAKTGYAFAASRTKVTINMEETSLSVQDVNHARATIRLTADNLYINSVTITGLTAPKAGAAQDLSVAAQEDTCQTNVGVSWFDLSDSGRALSSSEKFQAGHEYQVEISVPAKPGYEFPGNAQASVDGKWVSATKGGATGTFRIKFPSLAEVDPPHIHTPSEWRMTQVYHYKVCTSCGDMLGEEDHKGGVSSCAEPMVCSVCGYAYKDANENHTPDTSKWVPRGDMYHFHKCIYCGAHCDVEDHRWSPRYHSVGAEGHAYQCADCQGYDTVTSHNPGPAATETAPQTCKDCGYVIAPAKKHTHDLSKVPQVPATCTQGGNMEYYVCTGCMDCFSDSKGKHKIPETMSVMVGALGHTASDDWKHDGNYHWRICTVCKEVLIETQMVHELEHGRCTTCVYEEAVPEETTDNYESTVPKETTGADDGTDSEGTTIPTEATPTEPQPQKTGKRGMPWWALLLVGLVAVGAGVGGSVLVLKLTKKKE